MKHQAGRGALAHPLRSLQFNKRRVDAAVGEQDLNLPDAFDGFIQHWTVDE
jgi:hypothetical protein